MGIIIMFFQLSTIFKGEKWPKSKNEEKISNSCLETGLLCSLTPLINKIIIMWLKLNFPFPIEKKRLSSTYLLNDLLFDDFYTGKF